MPKDSSFVQFLRTIVGPNVMPRLWGEPLATALNDPVQLGHSLLTARGQASGLAIADRVLLLFETADSAGQTRFFHALRARPVPADRQCIAFFHPAMPDEPLTFVEVALTGGLAGSIQAILANKRDTMAATGQRLDCPGSAPEEGVMASLIWDLGTELHRGSAPFSSLTNNSTTKSR